MLLTGARIVPPERKPAYEHFFQVRSLFHHGFPDMARERTTQLRAVSGEAMVQWMGAISFAIEQASHTEQARLKADAEAARQAAQHLEAAREIAEAAGHSPRDDRARSRAHTGARPPPSATLVTPHMLVHEPACSFFLKS